MSQERRKKQQERTREAEPNPWIPKIAIGLLIVIIVAGGYMLIQRRETNKLNAFAKCLGDKGAKMYGAYWCPHCADQKERFGSSFQYAPYVECGIKGSRTTSQVCTDANVKHYPTWVFADGSRVEGDHPLDFLSQQTGCPLP